jgi:hypothetical protein
MTLWNVEFTDQFEEWWETLRGDEQRALTAAVQLLERDGPALGGLWRIRSTALAIGT